MADLITQPDKLATDGPKPPPAPRRALALAFLAGIASGGLLEIACHNPLFLSLGYTAPLPLLLAGLALGYSATYIGLLLALATLWFLGDGGYFSLLYFGLIGGPSVLLMHIAYSIDRTKPSDGPVPVLRSYAATRLYVIGTTFWSCLIFIVANLLANMYRPTTPHAEIISGHTPSTVPLLEEIWRLTQTLIKSNPEMLSQLDPAQMVQFQKTLPVLIASLPALLCFFWALVILLNAWGAAYWAQKQKLARRAIPSIESYTLPHWFTVLPVLTLAGFFIAQSQYVNYVLSSLFSLLCLPYLLLGLTVWHAMINAQVQRHNWPRWSRITLYVLLYIAMWSQFVMFVTILLAIAEQWLHLRRRFAITAT